MPSFFSKNRLFSVFFTVLITLLSNSAYAQSQNKTSGNASKHAKRPVCVYISSYQISYPWQKGIEEGLHLGIDSLCRLKTFYMRSKKIHSADKLKAIGLKAKAFIEQNHPDIILFSDDNAVHYVLKPYFQNSTVPTIFCGLNNDATHYHFTSTKLTGMVEIKRFGKMHQEVNRIFKHPVKGVYLGGPGSSESANIHIIQKKTDMDTYAAHNNKEWFESLQKIQNNPKYQFILIGNTASIPNWDAKKAKQILSLPSNQLYVSHLKYMIPYADIGIVISAQEQGNWLVKLTRAIFSGIPIENLPIITNRTFHYWYNSDHLERLKKYQLSNKYLPYHEKGH